MKLAPERSDFCPGNPAQITAQPAHEVGLPARAVEAKRNNM